MSVLQIGSQARVIPGQAAIRSKVEPEFVSPADGVILMRDQPELQFGSIAL
ncbi:hypothetical protein ACUY3S_03695 [Corynebacterium resistens]